MKQHREEDQGGKEQGKSAEMIRKRHEDGQEGEDERWLTRATLIRGESQIETERFDSPAGVEADPKSSSSLDS